MRNKILTITIAVCFAAGAAQSLRAQGSNRISRATAGRGAGAGLRPSAAELAPLGQYAPQDLENLRAELLNIADAVRDFAAVAPPDAVDLAGLQEAKGQIQQMSYRDLNVLRQGISPSKVHARMARAREAIADYSKSAADTPKRTVKAMAYSDPTAFPISHAFCTSEQTRTPTAVILAADVVWFVADGVREFAQDACKQEAVVLGEGGNTSLACIAVDVIWIAAKAVDEGIHFCDDDFTGAVVDASYERLDDIHTDVNNLGTALNAVDTHLSGVNTEIDTRVGNVDTHLTTVNTEIDTRLTTVNTEIDGRLAAGDTHLTNVNADIDLKLANLATLVTTLIANLSSQVTAATNQLAAGEQQIMKLDLTPEGLRQLVGSILTCDGTTAKPCPSVLHMCPLGKCSWNSVGPLP
jgi:hypothetical protein